jgi:hypothetical protein
MRKYIPLALLAVILLSCGKEPVPVPAKEQSVIKTITFQVYAARDYSGSAYQNTQADVVLRLGTIDKRTGIATVVWDTTFTPRSIAQYPRHAQMYVVEKSIPVNEQTQSLNGTYGIKYNTDGSLMQEFYSEGLDVGQKSLRLDVSL